MVDMEVLKNELSVFYDRPEFRENSVSGCLQILKFIISFGLDTDVFKEVTKVLRILITMPMSTSQSERCFSTLKLIKTYLRNRMGEERLSALAMLSIEKDMVSQIPDFNSRVVDKFCETTRRMEFHYK